VLKKKFSLYWWGFDLATQEKELKTLEKESEAENLWDDAKSAQDLMKRIASFSKDINAWRGIEKRIQDALELAELKDESLKEDLLKEIEEIEPLVDERELRTLLSGQYDQGNALLSINAGAGGTEAQDWAMMLQRMYLRWIERSGYKSEILDLSEGEEAGIKSVTILVKGDYAFGYLRAEKGVHRLVRISPYDSAKRRHTSFAQIEVLPQVDDAEIEINEKDIKVEVFLAGGAGGQSVQKNQTAIRITHIPSGVVASSQNERSQTQNRENAMKVLKARLLDIEIAKAEKEMAKMRGDYQKTEWGSQIRSYVMHPYQMVKDHRTEFEMGNTQGVLDGDLDGFIEAYLRSQVGRSNS
jgi:peptide chain release factor 2